MRSLLKRLKKLTILFLSKLPFSSQVVGVPSRSVSIHSINKATKYIVKEASAVELKTAVLNDKSYASYFSKVTNRKTQEQSVTVLPNGRVWGRNGAVITDKDEFVYDVSREFGVKEGTRQHSIYHNFSLGKSKYYDAKVAVVTTAGTEVYYHWMLDVLPRIMLLKQAGVFDEIDYFVLDFAGSAFQKYTLEKLGVAESAIINCRNDKRFHIHAKELYVPTLVSNLNEVNKLESEMLSDVFLKNDNAYNSYEKVYISREKNGTRVVINENELWAAIEPFGFKKIFTEDYSIEEQAFIFNKAEVIIGAHGSAFANMVFASEKVKLVDIIPDTNIVPCFYNIAEQVGAKYFGYIDQAVPINDSVKNDSIKVDINKFISFYSDVVLSA